MWKECGMEAENFERVKLPDAVADGAWFEQPRATRKQGFISYGAYSEASFMRPFYEARMGTYGRGKYRK